MKRKEVCFCFIILFVFGISVGAKNKFRIFQQSNTPPVVAITNPKKGAVSSTPSVAYSI